MTGNNRRAKNMNQQTQSSQESSQDILYELHDGIGRVTFNRPQARNAFTFAMYERLAAICDEANRDRSIKVLVLQGAGDKAFASGTDINQFRAFTTPQHALDYESRIDRVLTKLEQCRVPTLAAISGACTGGRAGVDTRGQRGAVSRQTRPCVSKFLPSIKSSSARARPGGGGGITLGAPGGDVGAEETPTPSL